jgi:CRP-like cAMP-binding protein
MILDEQDLDRILVLKRIPLFRYLSLDTLLAVSRAAQSRSYLPGEVIAPAGERLEHCHIVETGVVSLGPDGATRSLSAPTCLNELVMIGEATEAGPIVALEPCRVLRLHAILLQDLSRDHPEILLELCRSLARRLRAAEAADRTPARTAAALSQ